jgi:hypothetical protein
MSRLFRYTVVALGIPAGASAGAPPPATILNSGTYITPAAAAEQAAICPTGAGYPAQFVWDPNTTVNKPGPATSGKPRIEQYRAGQLVATYTSFDDKPGCTYKLDGTDYLNPGPPAASGCGPFTHVQGWRLWEAGDLFKVYPAVYNGIYNNFALSTEFDAPPDYPNNPVNPSNITIEGVVKNGVRPVVLLDVPATHNALYQSAVYFGTGSSISMSNIDVMEAPGGSAGVAGVYVNGETNLTLSNVRISGFTQSNLNGLFFADGAGTLLLDQIELDHNGGNNAGSLAHNAYINAGTMDPNFTVFMQHSWTHDAYLGHLFKTRAPFETFVGNYFQGGLPQAGNGVAESYLLDVPNGGVLTARNNIFVKNASGQGANGVSITFGVEGIVDSRALSIDLENNSFVSFSAFYNGYDYNYPFFFYDPAVVPGTPQWPSDVPYRIIKNAFVGYCPVSSSPVFSYRGDIDVQEAFSELSESFQLLTKVDSNEKRLKRDLPNYQKVVGTPAYEHAMQPKLTRKVPTIGAED